MNHIISFPTQITPLFPSVAVSNEPATHVKTTHAHNTCISGSYHSKE